jgi:hypothetical protein
LCRRFVQEARSRVEEGIAISAFVRNTIGVGSVADSAVDKFERLLITLRVDDGSAQERLVVEAP